MEDSNNCKFITLVECIGGGSDIIPNMPILSQK